MIKNKTHGHFVENRFVTSRRDYFDYFLHQGVSIVVKKLREFDSLLSAQVKNYAHKIVCNKVATK